MKPTLQIQPKATDLNWYPYMTRNDSQSGGGFESDACEAFSAVQNVEMVMNWMLRHSAVPGDTVLWLRNNGYLNGSGNVELSERYIASLSGTTRQGNSPKNVWEAIQKYGLVPLADWDMPMDQQTTWDAWYASVPPFIQTKGLQFRSRFRIVWETMAYVSDPVALEGLLSRSPLQVQIPVPAFHAVNLIQSNPYGYGIYDQYLPYEYLVAKNYPISTVTHCDVTPITMDQSYSKSFLDSVSNTLGYEGGLTDDPKDPGGLTNFGISKHSYPDVDIANLTREQAIAIYHSDYWIPIHGDQMPECLAMNVFDCAVNCGTGTAVRMMQKSLGTYPDGKIGPKTLSAMAIASKPAANSYCALRISYYHTLSGFGNYGNEWISRAQGTLATSLKP